MVDIVVGIFLGGVVLVLSRQQFFLAGRLRAKGCQVLHEAVVSLDRSCNQGEVEVEIGFGLACFGALPPPIQQATDPARRTTWGRHRLP